MPDWQPFKPITLSEETSKDRDKTFRQIQNNPCSYIPSSPSCCFFIISSSKMWMTRLCAILIRANKQEKGGKDSACEGVWANAYGSACVSTCVGEPYAAKWQPRGGERLMKTECENWKERKSQKCNGMKERQDNVGREKVCETVMRQTVLRLDRG